jgi:hypothetical protein
MNTTSTTSPDSESNSPNRPANFTRRTTDLAGKFRRNRQWHLLALYHLLRRSDFGREGIERSGSYLFADHLYRNQASGKGWFGRWLDRRLLNLPASRAMGRRYLKAQEALRQVCAGRAAEIRVLAVPCGIPRDVSEWVQSEPALGCRLHYVGMDLDPRVLEAARDHLAGVPLASAEWVEGDALRSETYPKTEGFNLVISTGLGEFLDEAQLTRFYGNVFSGLKEGGVFFTSATAFERRSHFLMRTFELKAHYRSSDHVRAILETLPWQKLEMEVDPSGLQTFIRAVK